MKITRSAISLNVDDVEGSARFALEHLGFVQEMADDGFVSLTRDDAGFNLIFLRTGLGTFKPQRIAGSAGMGTLIVFVVEDIDAQYERLMAEGAKIVTPMETEPWGERFFQMEDPSGIVYQLVQWIG
ncbi:MAG TPA: VOC family protein [Trueperaceae bacterium]|nr:VOC family protein [Trueperaceae bacterium]